MAELRALHLLSKWRSGGSAAVPFYSRRGGRGGAISCHPRSLPDYCCCCCCERPQRRANVAPTEQRMVHGGVAAAAVLEVVAMVTGCFLGMFPCLPSPVDPWWRGAGASRSNWARSVRTPSAAPHSHPAVQSKGGGGVAWRSDPGCARRVLLLCHQLFLPLKSHPSERHVTGRLRAGRAEFRAGGGGGGGGGGWRRRRRCGRG